MFSCREYRVSEDPSLRLEFSVDTLRFDTVFTEQGSSTARVMVYNRNKNAVLIDRVWLANGTAFQVNIDGEPELSRLTDLQLNGGGRMPMSYITDDGTQSWDGSFKAYEQLSAQVTRHFRHCSIYVGGENITNFKQKNPIVNANAPWTGNFDSTLIWGPIHGAVYYIGVRFNWNKI